MLDLVEIFSLPGIWTVFEISGGPKAHGLWIFCLASGNFYDLWNIFHKRLMITSVAELSRKIEPMCSVTTKLLG
jgi:hypothetical protein